MAKVYTTLCIVKKNGKSYNKGSVIKDLTDEEIKRGLAEHWLEAVGNDDDDDNGDDGDDEETTEKKPSKPRKPRKEKPGEPGQDDPLEKMTADELIAEAVNLGLLRADESMPADELRKIIREARQ